MTEPQAAPRRLDLLTVAGGLTAALPVSLLFGKAPPDVVMSLVTLLFLAHATIKRDFAWARTGWFVALAALWAWGMGRTAIVGMHLDAVAWIRFPLFTAALGSWVLRSALWRRRLVYGILAFSGFLIVDSIYQFVRGVDVIGQALYAGKRLTSVFHMPKVGLNLAWFFAPVAVWLWQEQRKALAGLFALACMGIILLSGDRYALLYALCLIGLLPLFCPQIRKPALLAGAGAFVVLAAGLIAFPEIRERQLDSVIDTIIHVKDSNYGIIWWRAMAMFETNPVFGLGIGHYKTLCPDPIYGSLVDIEHTCALHPHQFYLQWLVGLGLVGLVGWLAWIALAGRAMIAGLKKSAEPLVLLALILTVGMRFFPLGTSPSFFLGWASMPLFLYAGWALALAAPASEEAALRD